MTAERLIRLLQQPGQLALISYEELKTLVLAYPFSPHLRQLLLLKAQQTGHHEYERNLAAAAAHSIDRSFLYHLIVPVPVVEKTAIREEILELKPIATLMRDLEAIAPVEKNIEPVAETAAVEVPQPVAPPAPARNFGSWVGQFNLPVLPPAPPPPPPSAPSNAAVMAQKSVEENREVLSETLAKIMARQGHHEKAISMYERLMVAYPEKSAIFAAAIEELKK